MPYLGYTHTKKEIANHLSEIQILLYRLHFSLLCLTTLAHVVVEHTV